MIHHTYIRLQEASAKYFILTIVAADSIEHLLLPRAQMAELVDALRSGRSGLLAVEVRVLFWAPAIV